jgi:hypothetical protein
LDTVQDWKKHHRWRYHPNDFGQSLLRK